MRSLRVIGGIAVTSLAAASVFLAALASAKAAAGPAAESKPAAANAPTSAPASAKPPAPAARKPAPKAPTTAPAKPTEPGKTPQKPKAPTTRPAEPPKKPPAPAKPAEPPKKPPAPAKPAEPPKAPPAPAKPAEPPKKPPAPAKPPEPPKKPALAPGPDQNIRFQFDGIPYLDVVRRFAQMAGKPLLGGMTIAGSLTFHDSEPYTYEEALDTLNIILAMRGYILRESGRFLKLVPLATIQQEKLRFFRGLDETAGVREGEIVTILLPLRFVDAETASKVVVRMVSAYGSIAPLGKGKGVIITDHLSNIRRIAALLKGLDAADIVEKQLKTIELKRASARAVAEIINKLFGRASPLYSRSYYYYRYGSGSSRPPRDTTEDTVTAAYDERTNMVFLMGSGDKLAMAEEMIRTLDSTEVTREGDMRIVDLANARAEDVVKTITPLLPAKVFTSTSSSGRTYSQSVPTARVVADAATNRLIISAPVDAMNSIVDIIKKLDTKSQVSGGVKIFQLKHADASQMAPVISAAVARQTQYTPYSRYGRSYAPTPSGMAVSVTPDTRTNSLIVVGPAVVFQAAETLIKELDREIEKGTAREVHVIQLPSGIGSARSLASTLERMFEQQSDSSGYSRWRRSTTGVRIEAEPSTNCLLISATPGDWTRVKELLDKIIPPDAAGAATTTIAVPVTKIIPLKVARASELAETLRSVFGTRRRVEQIEVLVVPNDRTNTLLVSAAEADHKAMAELIKTLDVASTEQVDPIEIIRLKTADANKVASTLRAMLPPVPRWGRRGGTEQVYIHPDPATNSVIIRAPEAQRRMIQEMISKLDEADQAGARETRILKLKNVPASQMAATVSQLYAGGYSSRSGRRYGAPTPDEDRILITPAPGDQALILDAPRKKMEEIVQLIQSLDQEKSLARQEIRTYTITEGSASEIAANLTNLFSDRYGRSGRGGAASGQEPPRFEVNVASNQLLVAATPGQFEQIEALLKEIQSRSVLTSETKTFVLKFAPASEVVNVLTSMLQAAPSGYYRRGRGGAEADLRIAILPGTNSLVMQGPPNKLARAEELIKSMDTREATGASVIHIIRLKNASAATVADSLRAMLPRDRARAQEVFIQPDTQSNSILLRAPESQRKIVEELIAKLDAETAPVREMRVIPLKHASAGSLAQTINVMYAQPTSYRGYRGRPSADPTEQIIVTASPDDKSLLVEAPVKKVEEIAQLVKQLDTAEAGGDVLVRTYQLKNANAVQLVGSLGQIFAQRWAEARRRSPRTAPPQPTFEANAASNQLIVSATDRQFEEIEKTVAELEKASVLASATKTFTLKHAKAGELVSVLQSMLQTSPYATRRYRAAPTEGELRVASLPGTNTIVVQGPPDKVAKAEELIQKFDTPEAETASVVHIVQLKNQKATALAETLRAALPQGLRGREEEISIQPDPLTNSLLIRASAKQRKMVEELIAKLDAAAQPVREMKIVKVRFGSAYQIASTVETMCQQAAPTRWGRRATPTADPTEQVIVTASPDDRSIIVEAPVRKMPAILQLISNLDTEATSQEVLVRTYQLKNANAAELAESLGQVFGQRWQDERRRSPKAGAPRPTFQANAATNQLLVAATAQQLEEIEKALGTIEKASVLASATRTFILRHADATELVGVLQTMLQTSYARRGRQGSEAELRISTLGGSNAIVVQGPPDKIARAEEIVKSFDTPEAEGASVIHILPLKNASASALAETIRGMLPPAAGRGRREEISVQADSLTNSLLVRASQKQRKMVEELIAKLDAVGEPVREMRVIPLKFASAAMLAQTIGTMYAGGGPVRAWGSRGSRTPQVDSPERVVVSASPDDKALIVDAPVRKMEEIAQLVQQLDTQRAGGEMMVRTYRLTGANAAELAGSLGQVFAQRWAEERRRDPKGAPPQPTFQANAATNQLIVGATASQFEEIEKSLADIEKASVLASATKTFTLRHAKADELVTVLQNMLQSAPSYGRRGYRPTSEALLRVAALAGTNTLVVQGPPDKVAKAEELIQKFDTPEAQAASVIQIVALKNQNASALAETIRGMLPREVRGLTAEVAVQADPLTNSLLIRAAERQRKMVEELIAKLDAVAQPVREMKIVKVQFASAYEVAGTVQTMYQQASPLRRGRAAQPPDPAEQVVIAAAPDDRSVIVEAPVKKMPQILQLISDLDTQETAQELAVRTYQLKNAAAADLAGSLGQVYAQRWQEQRRRNPKTAAPQPSFQANAATNQLIVGATARQFEQIEKSIADLEKAAVQASATKTFRLKHARAEELVGVLSELLQAQPSVRGRWRQPASEGEVRIAALPGVNAIVVQGPPNKVTQAEELIRNFDAKEAAEAGQIHMIELKNATASAVAETLRAMIPQQRGRTEARQIFIEADAMTNSVLIRAPQTERKMVEEMIAKLDTKTELVREMRVIPLKFTSAAMVASTLQTMYAPAVAGRRGRGAPTPEDPAERVIVTAAPNDQAVVVEAPSKKLKEIADLVAQLDMEEGANKLHVRTYKLSDDADPAQLAQSLSRLYTQQRGRTVVGPQPRFEGDVASQQLLVAATQGQFQEIEKLLKQVDTGGGLASRIRTFKLKFTKASELLPTLEAMLTGQTPSSRWARGASPATEVRLSALTATNAIIVQGPPAKLALAEELIKNFDTKEAAERIIIQIVKLQNSQAHSLADAVNAMLARQAATRTRRGLAAPAAADDRVVVTAEPNSNSLLVRGPAEDVPAVVKMIEQLDKGGTSTTAQVHVFPLKNSEATELAQSVGKLFQDIIRQQSRGARDLTPPPFSIAADSRTNSLIISTTAGHFSIVEELLKTLDQDTPMRYVRYIWLENADAQDVVAKLEALYADRKGPDKPVIEADEWTNALTIIARDADANAIESMVEQLDKASETRQMRVIPVTRMKAEKMAEIIQRVYGQMTDSKIVVAEKLPAKPGKPAPPPSAPGGLDMFLPAPELPEDKAVPGADAAPERPGAGTPAPAARPSGAVPAKKPGPTTRPASASQPTTAPAGEKQAAVGEDEGERREPTVTIAVDPLSNSLIISATRKELQNIEQFIKDLATGDMEEAEFRQFKIEHANPVSVADTLDQLFNPRPRQITIPKEQRGRVQLPPLPPPVITVVPDLRTRTLVVRAKPLDFDIIEPIIKHLDAATAAITELRVFPLQNTDAAEVAKNLQELFQMATAEPQRPPQTPARGRSTTPQARRAASLRQMMELQMAGAKTTKVDPATAVSISANRHTNSVIVSAPRDVMALIEKIIQELDQSAAQTKVAVVTKYPLTSAEVQPTVQILRELFVEQAARAPTKALPGVRQTPVIITGDDAAGMIIVSAPKEKHELIARVIEEIDSAQPGGKMTVKVYKIQNAEAASVASALIETLTKGGRAVSRGTGRTGARPAPAAAGPRISADRSSNSIVARASKEDHLEIARIIKELDVSEEQTTPVQMIPLVNANPTSVAAVLTRVFVSTRPQRGARGAADRRGVVIEAEPDTRMILVRADDKTFAKIRELVAKLDVAAPEGKVQQTLIPLQHAQAAPVAAALTQAFSPGRRWGRGAAPPAADEMVTIVAEPTSNSIIVTANKKNLERVQTLLKKLDTADAGGVRTELMVLERAKAADIAAVLSRLLGGGGRGAREQQRVMISADVGSNTLVMSGPAGELTKLVQMARQLDQSTTRQLPGTYIISLTNGEAVDVAAMVQTLYNQQAAVARRERLPIDPLAVAADEKANALVLATTKEMFEQVQKWVAEVEKMKAGSETPKLITLRNADPAEVERAVRAVFIGTARAGGRATSKIELAALPEQRALLIKASEKDYAAIAALVKKLDAEMPIGKALRTVVALKHVDAATLAGSLGRAFLPPRGKPLTPDEQVTIVAEPASNSIIVMANPDNLAKVQSLITKLDTADAGAKTQFLILQNAKAVDLAGVLTRVLATGRQTGKPPVLISPDAGSNALVLSGPAAELAKVMAMAQELDKAAIAADTSVYIVTLKNGEAAETAATIQQLYTQQATAARRDRKSIDTLAVAADEQANALVLATTPKMHKQVTEWVAKLEEMKVGSETPRIVPLLEADPLEVERAIRAVFIGTPTRRGRATGKIELVALPEQRALLVKAPEKDFKAIQALARQLDEEVPVGKAVRTIIPLQHADAGGIAASLARAFAPARGGRASPDEQVTVVAEPASNSVIVTANQDNLARVQALLAKLDTEGVGAKTQFMVLKNARATDLANVLSRVLVRGRGTGPPSVVISPDAASNALVLSGPASDVAKVMAMAQELDQAATAADARIYIVTLEKGEAAETATMIQQLYTQQVTAARREGKSIDPLAVTADQRANALVLATTQKMHKQVTEWVAKVEAMKAGSETPKVITLTNADPVEIERAIRTVFIGAAAGRRGAATGKIELAVLPEQRAILVKASQKDFAAIDELVRKLDKEVPLGKATRTIVPLVHGDAGAIAASLAQSFAPPRGRQLTPDELVTIVAEPGSNSIIVTANQDNLAKVQSLLKKLDTAEAGTQTQFLILQNAKAAELAAVISRVLASQRRTGKQPVTVSADAGSNALVLSGPAAELIKVKAMAQELDQAATAADTRVYIVKLTSGEAPDVALMIQQLYTQQVAAARREGKGIDALAVAADEQANALVLATTQKMHKQVTEWVNQIEAMKPGRIVPKVITLQNADATEVERAIRTIFVTGRTGRGGRALGKIETAVLPAQQAILVKANDEDFKAIAELAKSLDAAEPATTATRTIIPLKHAQAPAIATALTQAFVAARGTRQSPNEQVSVVAEPFSNSIIVIANQKNLEKVNKLLVQLDTESAGPTSQFMVLKNAKAADLAAVLSRVLSTRGRAGEQQVVISPDVASNALLLSGPAAEVKKALAMATELDQAALGGKTKRTILPLKHAKAATLATAINQAFAPERGQRAGPDDLVRVTAEPLSNTLIVTANDENLLKVQGLLTQLDTAEASGTKTQLLFLRNAKAADLLPVLAQIAKAGGLRGAQPVTISADAGANALIMAGTGPELEDMMKMAQQLDQAALETVPGVHIIQLAHGDAVSVAETVQRLYSQMSQAARRERRSIEPLAVSADDRANALIVATSKQMFDQVSQWVKQVEAMKPARGQLRLITIEHANPAEVDKAIKELFTPRGAKGPPGKRGKTTGGRVESTVLPEQRAILIDASDEDFETIQQLVKALDAAAAKVRKQVKLFQLKNANNIQVASALTATFRAVAAKGRPEDLVEITALPQTNAVVVAATKDKLADVSSLIEQLDKEQVAPKLAFKVYPLKNAQPDKILPALQKMLVPIQQTLGKDKPISVQGDQRTRSIIITAPEAVFDQIGRIIEVLDQRPVQPEADVLIIPLKKADAPRLARVLQEMLRPTAAGQVTPEARELQEQIRLLNVRKTAKEKIPQLDLRKPIKISSDPDQPDQQGSNSLIISSTPDNLKAMEAVVELMDVVPLAEGVRVRVIRLKHADAATTLEVLRQIFDQAAQRLRGEPKTSVAGKAQPESTTGKALVSPVAIAADLRTNTLVLSGVEESLAFAELILMDLDRVEGQIVTEVRVFRLKYADATRMAPVLQAVFAEAPAVAGTEGLRTQVTRLRTVLAKARAKDKPPGKGPDKGHVTELPKTRAALTIQADTATNMLVVAARSDVMPLIADVIQTMDVPGAGALSSVRIFPLQNADASRIQQVLTGLYTGPNAALLRSEDKPTIAVDTRTNALVVSANDTTFAVLDALIRQLDARTPVELRDIQLIPLKNAEAATLAPTLQTMMDERVKRQQLLGMKDAESLRVVVAADERSNSLVVAGSAEGLKVLKDLATRLDGASPALAGQIQLLALKEANAGPLSAMLVDLFNQRYQVARTPEIKRQKPIIMPDVRTNSLLVAANADDSKMIKSLLTSLDVKQVDPSVRLVVIPMKHNDAGAIGPTIQQLFQARLQSMTLPGQTPAPQDRVDVSTDPLSNSLIVSASKENLALIDELLKKVDVEPPEKTGIVRMYPLKTADAQRVATLLKGLISQGLYKPGVIAAGQNQALIAREKVAIEVDLRTNVLIVSASKENFAVIDEIVKRLDAAEDFTVLGDIRMFVLKRADATRLAQTLQNLFAAKRAAEQAAGSSGRSLPVSIIPDPRTNTLLVAGSRESFQTAEALIKRLDGEQVIPANEFRVFQLKQATATALQPTLERLFTQRAARGGFKDTVTIIADPRVNSLIIGATPEDMKIVETVIARMDVAPDKEGKTVHVFPLTKADATQVANTLQTLYRGQAGAAAAAVSITVDERINAIIVSAGSADAKRIAELISQLDTGTVTRVTEIRVFTLENADATELATILTDVLTQKPKPLMTVSPNRQTLLQFIATTKDGHELISQALQEGVLVIPDRRTNSLVVTAPVKNMPLLENLIRALDSTSPQMAEIRVFTLKNADARRMAEILTQLFRLQQAPAAGQRSLNYMLVKPTTQPAGGEPAGQPTASAILGPGQQYALSVTVDIRTNSLLIGGTKQYVGLASKVIEELDASPIQERQIQIYRLRNAQAAEIQTALRAFLDQERQTLTQTLGSDAVGAAQRLLEHEVAIVAEQTTNTLLLSASPRYFKTIESIIEELDQPPPQVLIQVLLAEVTLDDTTDWGFEWQYRAAKHRADGTVRREFQTGTDFGVRAAIDQFGGFSVGLTGGDFSFYLRALEAQGKVEILSRPQILASDNQQATINVGQRVPFVRNTRITDAGGVFNTIEYEDIGIILRVTPRINPDGFVKLEVAPEISSLTTSSVEISEGLTAPVFNSRKAETTITVQDGHTIVIGGLITTRDEDRETKVPILGDIPMVGWLFRTTTNIKQRTELLIILTPHVLRDIGEADTITDKQLKRLDLLRRMQRDELKEYLFRPTETGAETDVRYPRTRPIPKSRIIPLESLIPKKKPPAKPVEPIRRPAAAGAGKAKTGTTNQTN